MDTEDMDMDTWRMQEEAKDLIDIMPEDKLRGLLMELADNDPETARLILDRYGFRHEDHRYSDIMQELKGIEPAYEYQGYNQTISDAYRRSLEGFLQRHVDPMIDAGRYEDANETVIAVYRKTDVKGNDYNNVLRDIMDDCLAYWRRIRDNCRMPLKVSIMERLKEVADSDYTSYMFRGDMEKLIEEGFNEKACCALRLAWTDDEIETVEEDEPDDSRARRLGSLVPRKLSLMAGTGYPQEDLDTVARLYWELPQVREWLADSYASAGRTDEAIQILCSSRTASLTENSYDGRLSAAKETWKLIQIYGREERTEDCKRELVYYLFGLDYPGRYDGDLMSQVLALKEVCTLEEWEEYRERILKSPRFNLIWHRLLEEEGLYERLMNSIIKNKELHVMDRYEDKLKPLFPEQLKAFYTDSILKRAAAASTRDEYADIMRYLKKLSTYPGGQELAQSIAAQWKGTYGRKRAFMDELKKAGF